MAGAIARAWVAGQQPGLVQHTTALQRLLQRFLLGALAADTNLKADPAEEAVPTRDLNPEIYPSAAPLNDAAVFGDVPIRRCTVFFKSSFAVPKVNRPQIIRNTS